MLQIRLTPLDISRIRFAVSAVHQTVYLTLSPADREGPDRAVSHRRFVKGLGEAARPLFGLVQYGGRVVPDFVLPPPPPGRRFGLDDALDNIIALPHARIVAELPGATSRTPSAVRGLLASQSAGRLALADAIRAVHHGAFGENWSSVRRVLEADVARRAWEMATHGIDHVLSHLHPTVTWANPVLTIHLVRSGPELRLNGQGLILIPGAGRDWTIMTAVNDHEPASLVYPAYPAHDADRPALRSQPEPGIPPKQLIALFGQTRARVLVTVGNTASLSTTQIADHCAISLSSASEHATVLRQAGLLASNRRGETMRHSITSLGMRMLSQHR